jgi:mono/diheme cytochrome c family protein
MAPILAAAVFGGVAAAAGGSGADQVPADSLASDARKIVSKYCGSCHDRASAKAVPAALEVFDLADERWSARLTDRQLPRLASRMASFGVGKLDRERVAAFVAAEQRRRADRD